MTIDASFVKDNNAHGNDGGIFNDAGVVTMLAGTVINNKATAAAGGLFSTDGGSVTLDAESAIV